VIAAGSAVTGTQGMQRGWVLIAVALAGCGETARTATKPAATPVPVPVPVDEGEPIALDPQRPGDARRGWEALVTEGYVGCGVPRSLYDRFGGTAPPASRLERSRGAELPYFLNTAVTPAGVEIVTANCLGCHAAWLRGTLVLGLGEQSADFTNELPALPALVGLLLGSDARAELAKLGARLAAVGPYARMTTVGANPADHIAAVLFAHRDPVTLAWSDEPRIPLPLPEERPIPVDVPAWWLMKKKTAMFHNGAGRGDHARIMMTASVLCVDDVETARRVDAYFPDIRAYILSIEAPPYPGPIDRVLAARGAPVFEATCAKCHGTYGPGGRYASRVVPLARIGTDPMLARSAGQFAAAFTGWFNRSFYGERARLEPGAGYVPPPLDGVWATAPYLHNGSVPNLAALLDSSRRLPRTYLDRRGDAYDLAAVGWPNTAAADRPGTPPEWIYDASLPGHANTGHAFGDRLSAGERAAVIEYLKTL